MANKRMAKKAAKKAAEAKKTVPVKKVEVKKIEIQPIKEAEVVETVEVKAEEVAVETATEVKVKEVVATVEDAVVDKAETVVEKKPRAKRTTKKAIKTSLVVQAYEREVSVEEAVERATEDWCKSGNDRADLKEIAVYVKPEEAAIFYVINGKATGRVLF